jgi:3-hydroxyisobutyrate dehydrogenase-like beta-hydroxyacid dehydrogenase
MTTTTLGFVGLGKMGQPMVARLLGGGYAVHVYDPVEDAITKAVEAGAVRAASAKDVGDVADIVLLCLPSPAIVKNAAVGAGGVSEGSKVRLVIDLSTTGAKTSGEVNQALLDAGLSFVDSPVSGGVPGATKGTLTMMVAAPAALYAEVEPILGLIGNKLFHVGETPGLGQTLKLVNNILGAAAMAISSEAMVMGVKAGLDPSVMLDVINVSSGMNGQTRDKFPKHVLTRTFDFGFQTGLSYKDVRLCVDEAEAIGVPMVVGGAVRQFLAMANAELGPTSDFTEVVKLVEGWAGVEVRSK